MSKTVLKANLSKDSLDRLINQIKIYGEKVQDGTQLGIEETLKETYEFICNKMKANNLEDHVSSVEWKYDSLKNSGYIKTNDIVIIFHEFGTGIKGTQDEWANAFDYQVNQSGKGEKGWFFYNKKNNYGGITHGLVSKHIFYEAMLEAEKKLPKNVQISVSKTVGAMY